MPKRRERRLYRRLPEAAKGTLTRHVVSDPMRLVGGKRDVWLYQPVTIMPVPLMVVFDGAEYLRRVHLPRLLDNLVARGRIRPIAAVLVRNGGSARAIEYGASGATAEFVRSVLIPFADENLAVSFTDEVALLGASMGGLIALSTALTFPETVQAVISQSGAFLDRYGFNFYRKYLELAPPKPIRVSMDVGKYDLPGLLEGNRRLAELLLRRGFDVNYSEHSDGHNWTSWRDHLEETLPAMFPPS